MDLQTQAHKIQLNVQDSKISLLHNTIPSNSLLEEALLDILSGIYALKGLHVPPEIVEITVALKSEILERFRNITLREVSTVLRKGVYGDYGEYFGLNMVTFVNWLKIYWTSKDRKAVFEKNLPQLPPQCPLLPPPNFQKETALQLFEAFQQNKELEDRGNVVYDYLDHLKIINFTIQEKQQFLHQAKQTIRMEAIQAANQTIKNQLKQLVTSLEEGQGKNAAIVRAKKLALNEFFSSLIKQNKELENYLPIS